jgi:hypothetical protein
MLTIYTISLCLCILDVEDKLQVSSVGLGVGLRFSMLIFFMVSSVITFIATPKSMSVFGKQKLLIDVVTTGMPGSTYFSEIGFVVIKLAKCPITCIVCGSFLFLAVFLLHISLTIFAYIGISLMACNKGIFIQIFFNSSKISSSGKISIFSCFSISNLSGKGAGFGS